MSVSPLRCTQGPGGRKRVKDTDAYETLPQRITVFLYFKNIGLSPSLLPLLDGDMGACFFKKTAVECDEKPMIRSWGNSRSGGACGAPGNDAPVEGAAAAELWTMPAAS